MGRYPMISWPILIWNLIISGNSACCKRSRFSTLATQLFVWIGIQLLCSCRSWFWERFHYGFPATIRHKTPQAEQHWCIRQGSVRWEIACRWTVLVFIYTRSLIVGLCPWHSPASYYMISLLIPPTFLSKASNYDFTSVLTIVISEGEGPTLGPVFTQLEYSDLKDQGAIGSAMFEIVGIDVYFIKIGPCRRPLMPFNWELGLTWKINWELGFVLKINWELGSAS